MALGKIFGQRWLITLLAILFLSLIIWFGGPYVAIADHKPLEGVVGRLVAILLLVVIWAVWLQVRELRARRASAQLGEAISAQPDGGGGAARGGQGGDGAQLKARFDEALKTLRANKRGRDLYSIPWYMIIGPPGSGKTTALVHSGLNFPLEQKFGAGALRGVGGTRNCDWWFTDDAVLLDTAGRYTTQDSDASADARGWSDFLTLLKKHRGRRPINGVLVAISASDLLSGDPRVMAGHVTAVRHRLDELTRQLGVRLPVYLLVTKADLLAGFVEYFEDQSQEDRKQVWGITFPLADSESGEAPKRLGRDLEALLLRLQQRRLGRLSDESDPRRRSSILAFPAQFQALAETLVPFVSEAFAVSSYDAPVLLRGVYLTSGTQESTPIDRAMGAIARTFGVAQDATPAAQSGSGRAYFLERVLKDVVFHEAGLAGVNRRAEARMMALQIAGYVACAVIAVGSLIGFWVSYGRNVSYLADVSAAIQKYKDTPAPSAGISGPRLPDALPRLDALRDVDAAAHVHDGIVPWSMRFGLYRGGVVGEAATDAYLRELDGSLLPVLGEGVRGGVARTVGEPDKLFEYLKAYLMLGDPKRLDRGQLAVLASLEWRRLLPNQAALRSDLDDHTARMFGDGADVRPLVLDRALVDGAQAALATARLPVLMYSRLKLSYATDKDHAVRFDRVAGSTQVLMRRSGAPLAEPLSALYTRSAFDDFQAKGRLALVKQFASDAWVLGPAAPTTMAMTEVGDEVRAIYEADYIRAWDDVIKDITVRKPTKEPGDLEKLLRILGSPGSPLKEYLTLVGKNTNFSVPAPGVAGKLAAAGSAAMDAKAAQLNQMLGGTAAPAVVPGEAITRHFEAINQMTAGGPGNAPIDRMLQSFSKAANDLAAGAAAGGPASARAGQGDVLKQLATEAALMPASMAELVNDLSNSTQEVVSSDVRSGLEQSYRDQVVRVCKEAIAGRYPFEPGASNEVPLDDFGRIFGPGGVYEQFFKDNLQSLVDTSRTPWAWRQGGGEAVAIPGILAQFQAAQRIRENFFRPGSPQPEVRFTVTPVTLDVEATRFTMDVDGRQLEYRHGPVKSVPMQWPGGATGSASAQFEPSSTPGPAFTGSWALFRLLGRAQVQAQSDVRYLASFSAGSLKAQVQIEASSVRNPFAHPELLKFRCGG
jgi:type VI secretion system protein ImpL